MATFKRNSVGRRLFMNANVDLTIVTGLTLTVRRADLTVFSKTDADITIGTVDLELTDPNTLEIVTWPANTYCYISWAAGDLPVHGLYKGELSGVFPAGKDLSDVFTFEVQKTLT